LADLQRKRVNISVFICKVASESSRRRSFDEFCQWPWLCGGRSSTNACLYR
jgi:hypothetical protein